MPESSDPYTYPGTDVLRNILDIRDFDRLSAFEASATVARLTKLDVSPVAGRFDIAHLKAIHRYIFQDVYRWAGEFRTVNISKGGHLFGAAAFIEHALHDLLQKLSTQRHLIDVDARGFSRRAGFCMAEVNAIHPFRDGTVARSVSSSGNWRHKPGSVSIGAE